MQKIIVIGAGILGASTAYQLARSGADVTIIDRDEPGQATDAAAGIICPWISKRRNQAWYKLAIEGARFYPALIAELEQEGEKHTGYARVGALRLDPDMDKLAGLEQIALRRQEEAPEMGELSLLEPEEVQRCFPPLGDAFAALYVEGAARVDGRALRDALLRSSVRHGAKQIKGEAVLSCDGNRVTGVLVQNQKLEADAVLVCAGAWAGKLLEPLEVDFKVTYQKAQIIHLGLEEGDTSRWPVVMPPGDQYILAFPDQRIVIGATHENHPNGFDTRITAGGLQEVLNKALEHAPGLSDGEFLEARAGFRPFTPGFLPVIGPLPDWKGLFVANGLGASGLTMGPYIGLQLAKLALGQSPDLDLEPYKLEGALERL
ncbi:NAD(P)/FAD-dependent oxidoreductase [Paenibacillus physcomitrellae]|uniref:Oxidoreductase n=1 Tax=Paenibacillus physcomitrellae TaxID=1619311 RepID=A0ABQ1FNZ1_9BACL|nr:FAD-binding oxidoreductase [Paenibacillus physcomitrellae]GGA24461.1 oxidoreductase [Paenibacillus physcomitrellae]